jgi:hypothetical protein
MNENIQNNAPASGEEQMHNQTVETAALAQADSTTDNIQAAQETVGPNPVKREPYDGTKKLARTKADSMATINSCNGQLSRIELRAKILLKLHEEAKVANSNAPDFEAKRNIVLADKKVVAELGDLKDYQSELESHKNELLKAEEAEIGSYSFVELSW